MSYFELKKNELHLKRLYRQLDALDRIAHETAEQMDKIAAEIERTREAQTLLEMDRSIPRPTFLKLEII